MLYVAPPFSLLLEGEMVLYLTTVFIGVTIRIYTNILAKIKKNWGMAYTAGAPPNPEIVSVMLAPISWTRGSVLLSQKRLSQGGAWHGSKACP